MQNPREKISNQIIELKEQIWETKAYIESDICKRCSDMYNALSKMEQNLTDLQHQLSDNI